MGYTTDFKGIFHLNKKLSDAQSEYLYKFATTRRMKRDIKFGRLEKDELRKSVGLHIGTDGEYYVGGTGFAGQDHDRSIVNYNYAPASQPGLWCQWIPTDDSKGIMWDGSEKFYNYVEWLEYIIEHFIERWGLRLDGDVEWEGECSDDRGIISVCNNIVFTIDFNNRINGALLIGNKGEIK